MKIRLLSDRLARTEKKNSRLSELGGLLALLHLQGLT